MIPITAFWKPDAFIEGHLLKACYSNTFYSTVFGLLKISAGELRHELSKQDARHLNIAPEGKH